MGVLSVHSIELFYVIFLHLSEPFHISLSYVVLCPGAAHEVVGRVFSINDYSSRCWFVQSQKGHSNGRFTTSRLSHQAKSFTLVYTETHTVHRFDPSDDPFENTSPYGKVFHEVFYSHDFLAHVSHLAFCASDLIEFLPEETSDPVVSDVFQFGFLNITLSFHEELTPWMELTPCGEVERIRNVSWNTLQPFLIYIDSWSGFEECIGVRVFRFVEDGLHITVFNHLSSVHNCNLVGHLRNDTHVVGDQNDRHSVLSLKFLHEFEDLSLDGDVQCGRGLVRYQKAWSAGKSHGDHRTLSHTTGQLMRVLVDPLLGFGDSHFSQHVYRHLPCLFLRDVLMKHDRFHYLISYGEDGIQGHHGFLKDHGDFFSSYLPHLTL
ncbi:Hypothetical Protein CTN_0170 [Thermotoga neapolitana DSM 4359]|uniref:Uncharacterized protein n=1 Tax=Thermotoga neapolitana (strain ATCC 49049 / DSM 4359 / NBRC 107923 / NS-E) TaxID=309803 RepID=B9KBF0_THENN|nr:Hypothetical Protein CTN_0170 [Thermotoga neapolitana DSM 4359]